MVSTSSSIILTFVVLYSLANEAWKVTDFGFTMEGSSRRALTSVASRGTSSYRAPELLLETNAKYTNKVDMWALGCILYELVARARAFREDWHIVKYSESGKDYDTTLAGEGVPEDRRRDFVCKVIKELLDVEPSKRPRASELYERFISWGVDGVFTHRAHTDAPVGPIPESPTDVAVHEDDVQSHSYAV
jgi:serine/threonine protein kinase